MMDDHRQYLAQKLLTEDQAVTYRLLSRALKVHANTAKEMLYDFHKWQSEKSPDTLHATYMIYGTKSSPVQEDEDIEMTDSQASEVIDTPYSDLVPTYTLSLVGQEKLQESLSQYSEVTSLHIYSIAPHPLKDFQLLTDTSRRIQELSTADSKVYGTITNPNVRKRERGSGPSRAAIAPQPRVEPKPPVKQEAKPTRTVPVKNEESKPTPKPAAVSAPAKKLQATTSLKRQASSSGIGQMFAKAAAKPKKPVTKATTTSAAATHAEDNKASGAMSDDGEDDAEPMTEVKKEDATARQARKDRQAELRRMMEESDEEEEEPEDAADSPEDEPMDEEPPPPEPEEEPKVKEPAEVVSSTTGGRRRGRRRVTRKKQIMDEKGYLVTIQEQGWESFSEDEPAPAPPKAKPQLQSVKPEPAAKPKKGAASKGAGQGNIMSFFSKK